MADIATLTVRINAATGELTAELKALQGTAKSAFGSLASSAGAAGVALGTLAAQGLTQVASFALKAVTDVIALGGHLSDLSTQTGVSMSALQEWGFAAEQSGSSLDDVAKASGELGKRLIEGSKGTVTALQEIGLSTGALLALNPEQRFETVAAAIGKIADPAHRAALETDLLGKAGVGLDAAIQNFDALQQKARDLGIVISDETLKAADDFGDQVDILKTQGMALVAEGLAPILPIVVDLAQQFTEIAKSVMPFVRDAIVGFLRVLANVQIEIAKFVLSVDESLKKIPLIGDKLGLNNTALASFNKNITDGEATLAKLGQTAVDTAKKVTASAADQAAALAHTRAEQERLRQEHEKAREAIARLAAEEKKRLDALTGADVLARATQMAADLTKIGGTSALVAGELAGVNKLFTEAIGIAIGQGKQIPQWWFDIQLATLQADDALVGYRDNLKTLVQGLPTTELKFLPPKDALAQARLGVGDLADVLETLFTHDGKVEIKPPKAVDKWADYGRQISQSVISAVQGGGSISKAIGSTVGAGIGSAIVKDTVTSLTKDGTGKISQALGGMLGAAAPVLGAIGGQLLGSLVGKIFGPKEEQKVNDMRDQFIDAAGGFDALNKKAFESGTTIDALLDAKKVKSFEAAVAGLEGAFAKTAATTAAMVGHLQAAATAGTLLGRDTVAQLAKVKAGTEEGAAAFEFFKSQRALAATGLDTFLTHATVTSQQSATALVGALGGIYEDLRAQGLSSTEAFAQLTPTITTLAAQLKAAGFEGGVAFEALATQAAYASDELAGPLFTAAAGLGDLLVGTANSGRLTQEMFTGLTGEVTQAWKQIELFGKGGTAGLANMQKPLQTVWELWKDQGFVIDDTTQTLLDFAESSGVVGDQFRSDQDKMTKAIETLVTRMGELVKVLEQALPKAADAGAMGVQRALDGIRAPTIVVPVVYDVTDPPIFDTPAGVQGAATDVYMDVNVDGERIAEASARYSGRVLAPYGAGAA